MNRYRLHTRHTTSSWKIEITSGSLRSAYRRWIVLPNDMISGLLIQVSNRYASAGQCYLSIQQ